MQLLLLHRAFGPDVRRQCRAARKQTAGSSFPAVRKMNGNTLNLDPQSIFRSSSITPQSLSWQLLIAAFRSVFTARPMPRRGLNALIY
ncbi:hypothetical protein Pfl01_1178 [Pseudomonas fluorescens Pf0-1]|uniref:Uncharacterized protein n=1 Tax=Pseudomonas fluorescens (strain Pf0-1) TaxID=205922 RepID=Q3KH35_PSEPF|nr:hypothetical protein Pfl01_1178 [Pseudomonas fluorescens Pf0-1]